MKNLEKQLEILERKNHKKEQAENRIKQIRKKISKQTFIPNYLDV